MASPVICVLKGRNACDGVRIVVDYRYLNKYSRGDALSPINMMDVIQKIGNSKYISTFDATKGYWQTGIRPDHQWLTAFIVNDHLYEFTRTSFGLKSSGSTFIRCLQEILDPIASFVSAYVDDMAVHSHTWQDHLVHLDKFLQTIQQSGLTSDGQYLKYMYFK
jgi:hypothetical protein